MIASAIIILFCLAIAINYCNTIIGMVSGLRRLLATSTVEHKKSLAKITILIAARNEEDTIGNCLESLINQDYPSDLFEVIVINDQSTDLTGNVIDSYINSCRLNLMQLHTFGNGGKKSAIMKGILEASADIILVTDADCIVKPGWISAMSSRFMNTDAVFISGPVMLRPHKGFFFKFQCTEFNSLIACTAGSVGRGKPIMSNGANMGFRKGAFYQINNHGNPYYDSLREDISSGDDVFMLLAMKKEFGVKRILFLTDPEGIVYTEPRSSLKDFFSQRIRWTSKSSGYRDWDIIYTALTVFAFNILLVILLIGSVVSTDIQIPVLQELNYYMLPFALLLFVSKCLVDYILLNIYTKKFGQSEFIKYLVLFEPLVILYTTIIGIGGTIMPFRWKGRRHRI